MVWQIANKRVQTPSVLLATDSSLFIPVELERQLLAEFCPTARDAIGPIGATATTTATGPKRPITVLDQRQAATHLEPRPRICNGQQWKNQVQLAPSAYSTSASSYQISSFYEKPVALLYFLPLPQRHGALRQDMWRCRARRQKGRQPSAGPAGCAAGLVAFAKTPAASSPLNRPPLLSHWPERHRFPSDQSAPRWPH